MEGKVAVLGSVDFVMPFSALGLDTFAVPESGQEILDAAGKIVKTKYALVLVSENIAEIAAEVFDETRKNAIPCVVVVPFTTESTGYATDSLGALLKAATGINIFEHNK